MAEDNSWLDGPPSKPAPRKKPATEKVVRIESAKRIRGEKTRGASMQKRSGRKVKSWECDGQFVWFRRKLANPAILQRLTTQVAKAELKHITTSDDVEIYEVQASSPFKREERNLQSLDFSTLTRETVISACKRDWATFVDGLQEIAGRLKNARYTDGKPAQATFTAELYQDRLTHVFNMIRLRGGPSPQEVDREVAALRTRRGDHRSRESIILPG